MSDLIEALQILLKYKDERWPTICQHDELTIAEISPGDVSEEDTQRLKELSFYVSKNDDCFKSSRFGSA